MSRMVFLLEEFSAKVLLDGLLPRLFPGLEFLCIAHEGRQDLEKSVPRKLRAWLEPGVRFVVLRDNDGGDCRALKRNLTELCQINGRGDALVRIACQELEAWYLGEPDAIADAFDSDEIRRIGALARFRQPDSVQRPSAEIVRLLPAFQKVSGARQLAQRLTKERNISPSFQVLIEGIGRVAAEIKKADPR